MIQQTKIQQTTIQQTTSRVTVPEQRVSADAMAAELSAEAEHQSKSPRGDRRPRLLRWLLPTAWSTSAPLDGQQQAELKFIAYH